MAKTRAAGQYTIVKYPATTGETSNKMMLKGRPLQKSMIGTSAIKTRAVPVSFCSTISTAGTTNSPTAARPYHTLLEFGRRIENNCATASMVPTLANSET